ncbi:MAG TPA: hypothetical protein VIY48_13535 [Candidatus Paceibacterota bacterium]
MKVSVGDLLHCIEFVDDVDRRAGNLKYAVKHRRVTHTLNALVQLIKSLLTVKSKLEDNASFASSLEDAFRHSQVGLSEIDISLTNNEIYIGGAFNLDKLRQYIIVHCDVQKPLEIVLDPHRGSERNENK